MNHFNYAIEELLRNEGGYVNDPKDPGGETKFGISKRVYPNEDIANLTKNRAKEIYYNDYWLKNNLDKIDNEAVASAALDTVVNHGRGAQLIQQALQVYGVGISVDGKLGVDTLTQLNKVKPSSFLAALYEVRKNYYHSLTVKDPGLKKFLPGWMQRIKKWEDNSGHVAFPVILIIASLFIYLKKKLFV